MTNVSGDMRQIANQQIKQAYTAAHQAEALAELQSKSFAFEMNYSQAELSEALGSLKPEQSTKIQAETKNRGLAGASCSQPEDAKGSSACLASGADGISWITGVQHGYSTRT